MIHRLFTVAFALSLLLCAAMTAVSHRTGFSVVWKGNAVGAAMACFFGDTIISAIADSPSSTGRITAQEQYPGISSSDFITASQTGACGSWGCRYGFPYAFARLGSGISPRALSAGGRATDIV